MKHSIKTIIDGKRISVFPCRNGDVPIVYLTTYGEMGERILRECEVLECRPFHLVSISNLRWDEELSPWPSEPVVAPDDHFTGEADFYGDCLTEQIVPWAEKQIMNVSGQRILAGYSMSGLFALYALYQTDLFAGVISASGSVWYPEFVSYVERHEFLRKPNTIYLSLGDQERRTRNQVLSRTETCMKQLYSIYQKKGIRTIFEFNPGNHYENAEYRIAKGITWTLNNNDEAKEYE